MAQKQPVFVISSPKGPHRGSVANKILDKLCGGEALVLRVPFDPVNIFAMFNAIKDAQTNQPRVVFLEGSSMFLTTLKNEPRGLTHLTELTGYKDFDAAWVASYNVSDKNISFIYNVEVGVFTDIAPASDLIERIVQLFPHSESGAPSWTPMPVTAEL